jgi:hypothetical protein
VTAGRDHDAADLEPAALELAPGEHVRVFLPPVLWPPGWWRLGYRAVLPGLRGLFTAAEWAEGTLPAGRVTAGTRSAPVPLLAGLAGQTPGCPVTLERAATRAGSGRRHLVPCCLVRKER